MNPHTTVDPDSPRQNPVDRGSGSGGGHRVAARTPRWPMSVAVATSLVIIVTNSAAGFAAHIGDAHIDYPIAAAFTLAAVAGSLPAARLASRLPAGRLRHWFAYLVYAVAVFVVAQSLLNPTS